MAIYIVPKYGKQRVPLIVPIASRFVWLLSDNPGTPTYLGLHWPSGQRSNLVQRTHIQSNHTSYYAQSSQRLRDRSWLSRSGNVACSLLLSHWLLWPRVTIYPLMAKFCQTVYKWPRHEGDTWQNKEGGSLSHYISQTLDLPRLSVTGQSENILFSFSEMQSQPYQPRNSSLDIMSADVTVGNRSRYSWQCIYIVAILQVWLLHLPIS